MSGPLDLLQNPELKESEFLTPQPKADIIAPGGLVGVSSCLRPP